MTGALILIVEDNDKNRKLVRDVLTFKCYTTIEAETGEAGVRLAQEATPEPGPDRHSAARHRWDGGPSAAPCGTDHSGDSRDGHDRVMMSEDRRRVMGAGFDAYQGKPTQVNDFLAAVAQTLEHRRT
jgi:two-component system cell cycle response regulator DivK